MKFRIGWDNRDRHTLREYWDDILTREVWSQGKYTRLFEESWSQHNGLYAVAFSGWTGAALAALCYHDIVNKAVVCPANTMVATLKAPMMLGNAVLLADVRTDDLCMGYEDLVKTCGRFVERQGRYPAAVFLTHIGGHLAFDSARIQRYCEDHRMVLLEDCAHAHGATWDTRRPGTFGSAGVYSFYATKTITTGEGGMLVTKDANLATYARLFRNYGKDESGVQKLQNEYAMNYRMNEFTAAIGVVQTARLDDIVEWKRRRAAELDRKYGKRVYFPEGMKSGYYKYIVFEDVEESTGLVYARPVWEEFALGVSSKAGFWKPEPLEFPGVAWVCKNHRCVPIFYEGDERVLRWQ